MSKYTVPSAEDVGWGKWGGVCVGGLKRDLVSEPPVPVKDTLVGVCLFSKLPLENLLEVSAAWCWVGTSVGREAKVLRVPVILINSQRKRWGLSFSHSICSLDSQKDFGFQSGFFLPHPTLLPYHHQKASNPSDSTVRNLAQGNN